MAKRKGGNGRNSPGQRLGVKCFGGMLVKPGQIIVRQLGTKFYPGQNTKIGKDYTIFSIVRGVVKFSYSKAGKQVVDVEPISTSKSKF